MGEYTKTESRQKQNLQTVNTDNWDRNLSKYKYTVPEKAVYKAQSIFEGKTARGTKIRKRRKWSKHPTFNGFIYPSYRV